MNVAAQHPEVLSNLARRPAKQHVPSAIFPLKAVDSSRNQLIQRLRIFRIPSRIIPVIDGRNWPQTSESTVFRRIYRVKTVE